MAIVRGKEVPTIDVVMVTIKAAGGTDELALNTASKIAVEPQIETQEPTKLIIKGALKSQKPQIDTMTGNAITLTDNVFNVELVHILQGGVIGYDTVDTDKIISYQPPVAGSSEKGEVFELIAYSAIYDASGLITGYEKTTYPNCQGVPVSLSTEDNVFRVSEYTINSAPSTGSPPYKIDWIEPGDLPVIP